MRSDIYLASALVFVGVAAFVAAHAAASLPSRPASRLGRRGRRRALALAQSPSWARVEPLVRWLGVQLGRFLPSSIEADLDKELLYAGDPLGVVPQEWVALSLLCLVPGVAFGAVFDVAAETGGLLVLACGALGLFIPYIHLTESKTNRFVQIGRGLPYAVDVFTLSMSAGLDFPGAVRQYVSKAMPNDPLADEMEYLLQMLSLGHTRRAALGDFAARVPIEVVREFVQTVTHAEEKGHPLVAALTIQAAVSRMRRSVRAEEEAAKAGVRLTVPLGLVFTSVLIMIAAPVFITATDALKDGQGESVLHRTTDWRRG